MVKSAFRLDLTPEQHEFTFLTCKYPAFVGGFGSGKTEALAANALLDAETGGSDSLIALYEPTYDLVRLILSPRIEQKIIEWGLRYNYNKSEQVIYTSTPGVGDFIFRTLDNPERIIGYEAYRSHIDEIDTLKKQKANDAWNKVIARNRQQPKTARSNFNRVSVYTTPEGFNFVYQRWYKDKKPGYEMVRAKTTSNPFLPPDYVQSLRDTYPGNLVEAYINGEFVNLTSGSVYHQFDRQLNASRETVEPGEAIYIGMDFNVQKMAAVIHVKRDSLPHAVDEIMGAYDTPDMIERIKIKYPGHTIFVYPDSSGKSRKTVAASESDILLLKKAGFKVRAKNVNPAVRSRINSVNAMFLNASGERRYRINPDKCPATVEALEQQVYNERGEPDKSHDTDHPNDALGYFIHYEYPIISKKAIAY